MRTRTIFAVLLVVIGLIAFGPALIAVGSQEIAEKAFGCEVNLNYVTLASLAARTMDKPSTISVF
jgi:hypothetical protein